MRPWRTKSRSLLVAIPAVTLIGWACLAGPFVPPRPEISDELVSLARIRKLSVAFEADDDALRKAGFTTSRAMGHIHKRLTEAGIEVVEQGKSDDVPTLMISILVEAHPGYEELINYTYCLSIEQRAMIERIDRRLRVPTYVFVFGDIATQDELLDALHRVLDDALVAVIECIGHGTRAHVETQNAAE
ncbi:MAG: hypothetical protein CMJ18_06685 [Phycisphaeraceae bacterium]|nr:hypothetical protein [Phycisphaeraceae bacterium]